MALAVRLAVFFINLHIVGGDLITVIHGQDGYFDVSRNLFLGNGFSINPTPPFFEYSYGVPGYPYFLYFLLWLSGGSYAFTVAIQIFLGALIPVIGMHIARYLLPFRRASLIVGILLALAPYQILFSFIFYTEALFTVLFGIFLILFFKFIKNPSLRLTVWSAMFLGLATLTKPTVQYYVIIVPIFILWHFRKEITKNILKKVACFVFLFFLVLSPWLYRNYKTFDMINLSAQMPFNLYGVLMPSVLSIANHTSFVKEQESLKYKAADIFFTNPKTLSHEAVTQILRHPIALVELSILNGFTFFTHDGMLTFLQAFRINPVSYLPKPATIMFLTEPLELAKIVWFQLSTAMAPVFFARLFWITVTFLFFLGIYHLWRSKLFSPQVSFAVITVIYFMLTTMINGLTVNARFRMPIEPLIFAVAYAGFIFLYQNIKRKYGIDNIRN
ncbi:MAG: glycosyltransferase family 39 protein [bacterium]|nr:glycosyltransferase family 39 protein [bacterium]